MYWGYDLDASTTVGIALKLKVATSKGLTIKGFTAQSANYVEITDISSNPLFYVTSAGKIGIGTNNPQDNLHIMTTVNGGFTLESNNVQGTSFSVKNTSTNGRTFVFFAGGQSNVPAFFGVYDTIGYTHWGINGANGNMHLRSGAQLGWVDNSNYATSGTFDTGISRYSAGVVKITDGSTGSGSLLANNVGAGTLSPSAKIHAIATSEQLRLGYDTSN